MHDSLYFVFLSKKKIKDCSRQRHMIVCHNRDFNRRKVRRIARFIFPELFTSFFGPKIKICLEHRDYHPGFDPEVSRHETGHNWEKYPFLALKLVEKNGEFYCQVSHFP